LVPLLVFGVSLLISLSGMEVVLMCLSREDGSERMVRSLWHRRVKAGNYLRQALHFSLVSYVAGLGGFVTGVLN
jgi:hypothetical protein